MWSYLLSDLAPAAAGARSLHILDKSTFGQLPKDDGCKTQFLDQVRDF
jgi:hypothetical protein